MLSRLIDRRRFLVVSAAAVPAWSCRRAVDSAPPPAPPIAARVEQPPPRPAAPPLRADVLARFVDPLPIPPVSRPLGTRPDPRDPGKQVPFHRLLMTEAAVKVHRDVPLTRVWTYAGSFPGPTIEARSGEPIVVEWINALPLQHFFRIEAGAARDRPEVRAVVHVHGAKVPPRSDGYPDDWITPGQAVTSIYPNDQDAATLWYHDHAIGVQRLNQYVGLIGTYLLRDPHEAALGLPEGAHELPLLLCDRWFGQDGQLRDPTPELACDAHLVNGKLFPYADVEARRYRLRIVNASSWRSHDLTFTPPVVAHQIGTDQGLLASPLRLSALTLAPGERADVIVDFAGAAGRQILLQSGALQLMQFRVAAARPPRERPLPHTLRDLPRPRPEAAAATRTLTLDDGLLNGKRWRDPVTEQPRLASTEIWSLVNLTKETHPIHLHLVRFRVLDRQAFDADAYRSSGKLQLRGNPAPAGPGEAGWKDTVRTPPGTVTRILIPFEGYAGRYVWESGLLEHADNQMMRPFEVVETPT